MSLGFTGERIVPGASDCEPTFARKMYQEHVARYAFAAQLAGGTDVLDVGCGVGYGSQLLGKAGATSVLGFDVSAEAVEHARMNYFHPAVTFKVQDATAIEPGDGYGLVTCFELIEHIEKQEKVIELIKAALRKDGVLAISTPRPLDDIRTHFHVHEMSFEELYGLLKTRFRYVEPYFEVNCFTSFVGREVPGAIERIVPVSDRIDLENADYFVFLASDEPIEPRSEVKPLLTLNDDAYVLTLEKDVGILRQAENDHLLRIADLEREKNALALSHAEAVERSKAFAGIHDDTRAILSAVERIDGQVAERMAAHLELERVRRTLAEVQERVAVSETERFTALSERDALRHENADLRSGNERAASDLDVVRRAMADQGEQLATAQTEAFSLRADAQRLPEVLGRVSALENELNALRYRFEMSEATLARFRKSFSWTITHPLRWIWRNSRKLTGRSLPR